MCWISGIFRGATAFMPKEWMLDATEIPRMLGWEWKSECLICIIRVEKTTLWAVIFHRSWNCCKYKFLVFKTQPAFFYLLAHLLWCIYEWQAACVDYLIYVSSWADLKIGSEIQKPFSVLSLAPVRTLTHQFLCFQRLIKAADGLWLITRSICHTYFWIQLNSLAIVSLCYKQVYHKRIVHAQKKMFGKIQNKLM